MLALWILLGLCTFLALLLLLPLHIYLAFTPEAGFSFYARYAFLTIRPGSEPNEKLMEQIFTLLGLRDVSSTANARSAVSAKGVAATLRELGAVLRTLLGRVFWLLHRGTFRRGSLLFAVGAGDAKATEVIHDAGFALGASLGSLANILDPEVIVLSGGVIHQGPDWRSQTWKDSVHEGYASQALDPLQNTPILIGSLEGDAPRIGAAEHLLASLK